uniref:Uncharacterized protein n=1 Tax=Setaria italica TaxID=4555 RepID=A0A0Q3S6S7_SETIT
MNEVVELFDARPSFKDLVDCAMRKYGCGVDEMILRGHFNCGKVTPHYILMNLAFESNWKQYKEVVEHANVVCLEVVVDICPRPGANVALRDEVRLVVENGTQESTISQHGLGESQSDFGLAIVNDDFSNDTFEREEANIDDDDISLGSKDDDFEEEDGVEDVQTNAHEDVGVGDGPEYEESQSKEDGLQVNTTTVHDVEDIGHVDECFDYTPNELQLLKECHVELPSIHSVKDISMVYKAILIKKEMKFNSLEELKFFLADYAVRLHRPFSVVHSDKNLRYAVMCKQGCMWSVWLHLSRSTGQWRTLKVVQPHTCRSSQLKR